MAATMPPKGGGEDDRVKPRQSASCTTITFTPVTAEAGPFRAIGFLRPDTLRWSFAVYDMDTEDPSGRLISTLDGGTGPFESSTSARVNAARLCATLAKLFADARDRNV